MSVSCAICLTFGQAIFELRLEHLLHDVVSPDVVEDLIDNGIKDVPLVVSSQYLGDVLAAFSRALTDVFVSIR
jgi:hypothetical protein